MKIKNRASVKILRRGTVVAEQSSKLPFLRSCNVLSVDNLLFPKHGGGRDRMNAVCPAPVFRSDGIMLEHHRLLCGRPLDHVRIVWRLLLLLFLLLLSPTSAFSSRNSIWAVSVDVYLDRLS